MSFLAIVGIGLSLIVLLIVLESRRQQRKYGGGDRRGAGSALARAGLMEVQNLLEPERKVEVLREMERKEDLLVQLDDQGGPPRPTPVDPSRRPDRT